MATNTRLFLVLWLAGMAGVLSFLLVDLSALIAAFPLPEGTAAPELPSPAVLKLVSMIQPAILVSLAVLIGIWLSPQIGLDAPVARAFAERRSIVPALRPQIFPGIIWGLASGLAIVAVWILSKPFLPPPFLSRVDEFNKLLPHAVRILYGGFTEEILLRWGLMTFLVWLSVRIGDGNDGRTSPSSQTRAIFVIPAIVISAVIFGLGHLPVASALAGGLTTPIVIYVVTANSMFGIVAGYLYWLRGLEAAMIAHMFAHVVLIIAIGLGL